MKKKKDRVLTAVGIFLILLFWIVAWFNFLFLYWEFPHTLWVEIVNAFVAILFAILEILVILLMLLKDKESLWK